MYRYSRRVHNLALLAKGEIRIGTLKNFRRSEHARGIADPTEGKKTVSHTFDHVELATGYDPRRAALAAFEIYVAPESKGVTITRTTGQNRFESDDCFLLCTSAVRSLETMAQFEGAETCVEIFNPKNFYAAITKKLLKVANVEFMGYYPVIYQPRGERWNGIDWGHHPSMIKEPEYARQAEIRALWATRENVALDPQIITARRLTECCRIVDLPN